MFSSKAPLYLSEYNDRARQPNSRSVSQEYDLRPRYFQIELKHPPSKENNLYKMIPLHRAVKTVQ